jgi:uncharacterized membrane protein
MADQEASIRYARQLRRLETLMDVVFALVIWRLFQLIPRPADDDTRSVWEVLSSEPSAALTIVIGVAIVIIYWNQNNLLFGYLERTDGRHTTLAIIQLFCLLLFLYAIAIGTNFEAGTDTRLFESVTALMVGVPAYFGWRHAKRDRRLISPELSDEEADEISVQILTEPITAAITIPFAIFTPLLWEASWFSYPIVSRLLEKRKEKL